MLKPLFASLFALALTMPGCGKTETRPTPPPPPAGPRVGQPAPDIDGVDLEGEPMKLSDYRGKVVALSFWASWCRPCVQFIPHEKELVEKFRGKPFVLVGVNVDEAREQGKSAQVKHQVTWRSFHCGHPNDPIMSIWGVDGIPTIFLVDAKGNFRYRLRASPQNIESAIATLLHEVEAETKGKKSS